MTEGRQPTLLAMAEAILEEASMWSDEKRANIGRDDATGHQTRMDLAAYIFEFLEKRRNDVESKLN